jgi:hypothetical protein
MKRALIILFLAAACVPVATVDYAYDEAYVGGYPPAGYIATATPVYWGGYPHYFYEGRWYCRGEAGWRTYRVEPEYLRARRSTYVAAPRPYYGRAAVRVSAPAPHYGGHAYHR